MRALFEPTKYIAELTADERALLARAILRVHEGHNDVDYDSFCGFDRRIGLVRDRRYWLVNDASFVMQ